MEGTRRRLLSSRYNFDKSPWLLRHTSDTGRSTSNDKYQRYPSKPIMPDTQVVVATPSTADSRCTKHLHHSINNCQLHTHRSLLRPPNSTAQRPERQQAAPPTHGNASCDHITGSRDTTKRAQCRKTTSKAAGASTRPVAKAQRYVGRMRGQRDQTTTS